MPYTTNNLIADAYYAANIVSREIETVSGAQIENGLRWLNEIIGKKVVESDMIPYEGETSFNSVSGQQTYFIPNLIKIDVLTFIQDSVRYQVRFIPRNQFKGTYRVESIETLPYQYFFERKLGGCDLSLYFSPDKAYPFTITGIFRLNNISLGDNLEDTLDAFYISYLKYSLASKLCDEYSMSVPMGVSKELKEYQGLISKQSRPLDLSIQKVSTLQNSPSINWALVNFGTGWLP